MQKIGEKILELRLSKGLTQENLIPENPSQVSQIEKKGGGIKRPTEPTLNKIAKALGVDFKDLIDGTDWTPGNKKTINTQYAYSTTEAIVEVAESGEIISRLKSYPRFNEQGEENIFCPNTGTKLLTHCNNCSRSIDSGNITYCMSCGKSLGKYKMPSFTINNIDFISNQASIDKECKILEEQIESEKEKMMHFYNWLPLDEILEGYCPEDGYDQDFEHEFLDSFKDNQKWIDSMLNGFDSKYFNWAEFREKHEASNKTIRDTWCCYYLALSYYKGIIKELRRYSLRLSSSDIEDK